MRGAWSVTAVLALGVAITMFQMGGMAAYFDGDTNFATDDALEDQGSALNPNEEGLSGSANEQEGSIVGVIIGGGQLVFGLLGTIILLPLDMHQLGFPWWVAYPVGLLLQIHAGISGIQFFTQRRLE